MKTKEKEIQKKIKELCELMDEDDNEDEDCENCEFLKTCENESAIKYRKEHGIPKPKKGKGRKVNVN